MRMRRRMRSSFPTRISCSTPISSARASTWSCPRTATNSSCTTTSRATKHAALASPDGAHLTGDIVDALTGHVADRPGRRRQPPARATSSATSPSCTGSATVIRNGVSIILNNGDNVEKGDVVQSGSNSTLGITFIDGTVFGLSSNARMVLNEMVYDPNGSNNSSLLSLVAGTITFVAGETAKHGDMKIDTPVATMGIRGTAVLVEIDFSVPGANGAPNASFQVLVEPDGTTGSYILFDKVTLQPLAIVNQAGQQINISNGIISQTQNPLSPDMQKLITDVFTQKFTDNDTNTKTTSTIGSSTADDSQNIVFQKNGTTATAIVPARRTTVRREGVRRRGRGPAGAPRTFRSADAAKLSTLRVFSREAIPTICSGQTNDAVDLDRRRRYLPIHRHQSGRSADRHDGLRFGHLCQRQWLLHHRMPDRPRRPPACRRCSSPTSRRLRSISLLVADPGNTNNGKVTWTYSVADKPSTSSPPAKR